MMWTWFGSPLVWTDLAKEKMAKEKMAKEKMEMAKAKTAKEKMALKAKAKPVIGKWISLPMANACKRSSVECRHLKTSARHLQSRVE